MSISNKKNGSVLLVQGINVELPGEYLDDHSLRNSVNFEINRSLIRKRSGETELGGLVSRGTLTLGANAGDTNTVTIGVKVYTFQTTLTDVDGNVLIGASASASIDNLIAAINLAAGAGTTYADSMTAHPNNIFATVGAGDTMDIEVTDSVVATTDALANGNWGAVTTAYPDGLDIMAGREFTRTDIKYNIRVGLDKIEYYNSTDDIWVDITGTDLTGTTDDLVDTALPLLSGAEIICITNNKDAIRKWIASGDTADLGGTPPIAKFIQEYKTYLVCANIGGGTDISQRVQWSDTADPETWTGGNSGAVDLIEDGGEITGLNLYGNYVAVHKRGSIYLGYLVSSTDIFRFERKSTGRGTIANNSIVNLPTGEQIFLASDGIAVFNGVSATLIEAPINEEIRDEMDDTYAYRSWGVLVKDKDEVMIGIPLSGQTTGETVYKFNYKTRVLYKDDRGGATVAWIGSASAGQSWDQMTGTWDSQTIRWNERGLNEDSDQINIGHSDGTVTRIDETTTSDNGKPIDAYIITKDFQDSQQMISRWKSMELWAKGGTVDVQYSVDGGSTWVATHSNPHTLTSEFPEYDSPLVIYFDVVASKIRFKFTNNTDDEALTIKQFIIDYSPREYRR